MKMYKKTVNIGFEFAYPANLKVIVPTEINVPKFNIIECLFVRVNQAYKALKQSWSFGAAVDALFVSCDSPTLHSNDMDYVRTFTFNTIAVANTVWDLTRGVRIKDRYASTVRKLDTYDKNYFMGCQVWTPEQLKEWIKTGASK